MPLRPEEGNGICLDFPHIHFEPRCGFNSRFSCLHLLSTDMTGIGSPGIFFFLFQERVRQLRGTQSVMLSWVPATVNEGSYTVNQEVSARE